MGLTQVSKDGVKNDAIDASKLPANSVGASELANDAVDNEHLAANSVRTEQIQNTKVTLAKLPLGTSSQDGKFLRANNGGQPTFESIPAGTTINNNADNRVITGDANANTLNGESELTYDGSGHLNMASTNDNSKITLKRTGTSIGGFVKVRNESNDNGLTYVATDGNSGKPNHVFFTDASSNSDTPVERLRIQTGGGISFNGDTAAANALNDYEEGTYSPALGANGNISGGNGLGCTYTTQIGYYIKIGDFVFCNGILVWTAKSGTLNNNTAVNLTLSIPFAMGGTGNQGAGQLSYNSAIDFNTDSRNVHGVGSNSYVFFERVATGSGKHLGYVKTANLDSAGQINFAYSYRIL